MRLCVGETESLTFDSSTVNTTGTFSLVTGGTHISVSSSGEVTGLSHGGGTVLFTDSNGCEASVYVEAWDVPCLLYTSPSPRDA